MEILNVFPLPSFHTKPILSQLQKMECFRTPQSISPTYQFRNVLFNNFELLREINIYDNEEVDDYLNQRKEKIKEQNPIEMMSIQNDYILILYSSGLCISLHTSTMKVQVMNTSNKEVIHSIIYNTLENSIVFVSNVDDEHWIIRVLLVRSLMNNKLNELRFIFKEEEFPITIKFDDINFRLFSQHSRIVDGKEELFLKVTEMKNWEPIAVINITNSHNVCQCYDWFMVTFKNGSLLTFDLYSQEDARYIKTIKYQLRSKKSIEFILPFSDAILIKQHKNPLVLIDIVTTTTNRIPLSDLKDNSSFLLPIRYRQFITVHENNTTIWHPSGQIIHSYSNSRANLAKLSKKYRSKFQFRCLTDNACIAYTIHQQNVIFMELFTGEILGELKAPNYHADDCDCMYDDDFDRYFDAFEHNLDTNHIYTANSKGKIFIWK